MLITTGDLTGAPLRTSLLFDVTRAVRRERWRMGRCVAACLLITALAAALVYLLPGTLVGGLGLIVVVPALLYWLWQAPVRGVYVLFAAAVMQESQYSATAFSDDIGRYLPLFQDLATWTHVKGLSFSVAELLMLLVLVIWLLKGISRRTLQFDRGAVWPPLILYGLMVVVGELHGVGSGGDFRISLWELRPQAYMVICYILACNLITSRAAIDRLLWILMLGAGFKGIQGTWRYFISLHGNLHSVESIFPHEQSFFFNAFLVYCPIAFLFGASRRLKRAMLYLLPCVIIASLANQRRAAVLALGLSLLVLLVVTAIAFPQCRRLMGKIALLLALVLPPYYAYYSNKNGLLAQPARAVASSFSPDRRDASSNEYRVNEDKDILATMQSSPIIGYGFGKPMLTPFPLADISTVYVFWNIMPHDSILWIWMRLGSIGFALFWLLIGCACMEATRLVTVLRDPYLRGIAVLVLLLVLQEVVLGYLDLQWVNYRNLIAIGVCFALLSKLAQFDVPRKVHLSAPNER